ncbi:hypothetical protein ACQUW5_04315 [Legionella sp. CNM-1927-20]|uniref:hypothetical protein n=1 Tax=Legionella sp. CNM-1927-20 TaxID=3422221 RepID=UPI00403ADC89
MEINRSYLKRNADMKLRNQNLQLNIKKKKNPTENSLPKFLIWLKKQIESGNKRFSLDAQDLILYKPSHSKQELIFILPEVLKQYQDETGIDSKTLQFELKNALEVTFAYTIFKDEKTIEIFPCKKFF